MEELRRYRCVENEDPKGSSIGNGIHTFHLITLFLCHLRSINHSTSRYQRSVSLHSIELDGCSASFRYDVIDFRLVVVGFGGELRRVLGLVHEFLQLVHLFAEGFVGDGFGGVAFCYDGCGGEEREEDGGELHLDGLDWIGWREKLDRLLKL